MSTISRSEASHRLKIASAQANRAAAVSRDGAWKEAVTAVKEAISVLEKLLPHLEEADQAEPQQLGSLKYGTPPVVNKTGGMGYRGSGNGTVVKMKTAPLPAKPIITPPPVVQGLGNTVQGVVPKPIVTPPPPETVSFDLRKIDSLPEFMEWQMECYRSGLPSARTDAELKASDLFWRLDPILRDRVADKARATGAPVLLRVKNG